MAVVLLPLSPADFDRRRPALVAEYARKMVENMGVTPEQAAAEAERPATARGVPYVGLDVPGTEPPALAFAASAGLGLELISQRMAKKL